MQSLVQVLVSALVFALFVPKVGLLGKSMDFGGNNSLLVHALLFALASHAVSHLVTMVVMPALRVSTTVAKDVAQDSGLYGKDGHGQRMY